MVRSLIKSLFVYSAIALSVVLAAPANHHTGRRAAPFPQEEGKPTIQRGVTNAMRMANGLPPLAPRKLYDGSKAGLAPKPRTSATPAETWAGIVVYDSNGLSGTQLGYIASTPDNWDVYQLTTDCSAAMMSLQLSSGALTNAAQPNNHLNIGMKTHYFSPFTTTGGSYAMMAGTVALPPTASGPYRVAGSLVENNVWSLGPDNELFAKWVNSDETAPDTGFANVPGYGVIMVGSIPDFMTSFGPEADDTVSIRLYLTNELCQQPVTAV